MARIPEPKLKLVRVYREGDFYVAVDWRNYVLARSTDGAYVLNQAVLFCREYDCHVLIEDPIELKHNAIIKETR